MSLREAIMDCIMAQVDRENNGLHSTYQAKPESMELLRKHNIKICRNYVYCGDKIIFNVYRKYRHDAERKTWVQCRPLVKSA